MLFRPLAALLLIGTAAGAAELPLRPGNYVLAGTACKHPPFAAMLSYDGKRFSYPHARGCTLQILAHRNHRYRIMETCSAMGDGTPSRPVALPYTIEPMTRSMFVKTTTTAALRYHWCSAR